MVSHLPNEGANGYELGEMDNTPSREKVGWLAIPSGWPMSASGGLATGSRASVRYSEEKLSDKSFITWWCGLVPERT